MKLQLDVSAHLLPAAHVLLSAPSEAAEVRPSPSRVFLNCVRTVSPEGAPDGEGNPAGHEPAAPAGKGGGRERGYGVLCDSWCPGGAGLRLDRTGGGEGAWPCHCHRYGCTGGLCHLPCLINVPESVTDTGTRGLPLEKWSLFSLLGLRVGRQHDELLGDNPLDCLPSVSQGHLSRVVHGRSCIGLENLLVSAPIRQKLGLHSASKMSLFLYHLAFCCN